LPVDADVPDHIDNAARPAKRFASEAAKTLVRQELGSGYPRQAVERLAVQVDDLARQRPPIADQHIRAAVREWDTRPDCRPEWLPTVCSDVVKRSRALDVNGRHQPGINQPGIGKPTQKAAGYADAAARIIAQMENR
jgi:hypothetical protein